MVKIKDIHFCVKNLKMKRKKNKNFLTFLSGDLNPRFSVIFPPMIWIFMESEEPEFKSKQASKRDRTLFKLDTFWEGFWNPDIWEIMLVQPVFMKCILWAICGPICKSVNFFYGKKILNVTMVKLFPKIKMSLKKQCLGTKLNTLLDRLSNWYPRLVSNLS